MDILHHVCIAHVSRYAPTPTLPIGSSVRKYHVRGVEVVSFRTRTPTWRPRYQPALVQGTSTSTHRNRMDWLSRIKLLLKGYEFVVSRRVDHESNG